MKNITNLDMNLLVVFGALCIEKNTTKAAVRLGLSQPAVSHALSRLRSQFNDPLFVRASKGLVATKRALELEKPILTMLTQLDEVLAGPVKFTPAKAKNVFRIATTDFIEQVVLPLILSHLEKVAPDITIISRPTMGSFPKSELENSDFDLAIAGFYGELPHGFMKQKLFDDDFVCVSKSDHPRIKTNSLTLKQYAAEKHILISMQGDLKAKSKAILEKKGFEQDIRCGVASFFIPWLDTPKN